MFGMLLFSFVQECW